MLLLNVSNVTIGVVFLPAYHGLLCPQGVLLLLLIMMTITCMKQDTATC